MRRGPTSDPREGVSTFLGRVSFGKASAGYLIRCMDVKKVGIHPKPWWFVLRMSECMPMPAVFQKLVGTCGVQGEIIIKLHILEGVGTL